MKPTGHSTDMADYWKPEYGVSKEDFVRYCEEKLKDPEFRKKYEVSNILETEETIKSLEWKLYR